MFKIKNSDLSLFRFEKEKQKKAEHEKRKTIQQKRKKKKKRLEGTYRGLAQLAIDSAYVGMPRGASQRLS
jgi:hypothetical protein